MIVNVFGAGKQRQKDLEEAAQFFANLLMDPRMVRNLEIDVEVEPGLDVMGECINEDDTKNSRYFTIRLNRNHSDDIIKTLAHEMVHVHEFKNGLDHYWVHGKVFKALAKEVCDAHGFDIGQF